VISTKTLLVRLTPNLADICPSQWEIAAGSPCPASKFYAHECVGDVGHRGKHVCRCGSLRRVGL
jgi:hypothetical protein